jgi:hypothetical protein
MKWRDVNFYPLLPVEAVACDWDNLSNGIKRYFTKHGFQYMFKQYQFYIAEDALYMDTVREGGSMTQRYCKFPILEAL